MLHATAKKERTMTSSFPWRALLLVIALLISGPVSRAGAADAPVNIDVLLSLTGSGTFIGRIHQQTLAVMETLINKQGGIKGRPVHFVIQDDQTNPQVAVELTNGIIAKKATVMLGADLSAVCRAMAPLFQNGPVDYCLSPGVHPLPGSYQFTATVGTPELCVAYFRYLHAKGIRRVAVLTSTDASGQDGEAGVLAAAALPENKDMEITAKEHFNPTDVTVTAQITRVKASNAQALIAWTTGTPFGTVLRSASDDGLDIPILTTNGNMTFAQMAQYAGFLPKELLFPGFAYVASDPAPGMTPQQRDFIVAMKAAGIKPDFQSGMPWDPAMILIDALRHVGADAPADKVREYIANLSGYQGITGPYDFRTGITNRGLNERGVVVMRWDGTKTMWIPASRPGGMPL
jgi:branched-chain amino acid transport system substrate-binding protein